MSKEIKKLPKEVFDELKQLQGAIQNIEDIVSDDSCADWEFEFAMDRLTTDKEKEMAKKLGRIYMLAHSNNRSHSCYEVHKSWRKPSPQNSDSKPTTCNENCPDCPEEARKLNPLTPKVPDWEKEFDENFESEIKGLGEIWESHKIKSFIRQLLIQEKAKNRQKFIDALIWCSGSEDFQIGGKARRGWEKICLPLLKDEK